MHIPVAALIIILSISLALWRWLLLPKPRSKVFQVMGIIIVMALAVETYGGITLSLRINNSIAYNVFNLGESYLVLWLVALKRPRWKRSVIVLGLVITAAFITDFALRAGILKVLSQAILLNAVILSCLLMGVLWNLAQTSTIALSKMPEFWLFISLLIYFAGMVPLIGVYELLSKEDFAIASQLYAIIQGVCVTRYLLTAYAFFIAGRESSPHKHLTPAKQP